MIVMASQALMVLILVVMEEGQRPYTQPHGHAQVGES